ncbi:COX15/CtaA family protein [Shewanella oneidensis MR-1]|uniref:Heme A synthase n=1 Tax=Shewanella oneidensis (strain ATCC 700550 / JCM 31522 / CIP 106686 / LMG 19005 / NCIMB 14063 / MR-1) TaxID=211586 RepID=CTAA_SHEON|nr:COX15/CtaA family protein [Shewanella oneidensis]AAN57573.1 heme A synthase CtaA [Shewanella oneidensis MR-1]MDX5998145.1 COX15/CtaA family protein [Shewanella oneidensis]MEE2026756.1 Heme A synthase [Shewanella oneidensis]QKG94864.1 COX15/CtaA family protein [Shewanella oneidensis MR-1]
MQLTWLLRITLVFTLLVILMGAYTRLSDAGLGCPDWPGCYGHIKVPTQDHELSHAQSLFPDHDIEPEKAWLEMIHRYIAGGLGLLVLCIWFLCLKTPDAPKKLPLFIVLLILFQGALGMWTVTMKLMPIVVMSHLLGGFSLISLLLLLYLRTRPRRIVASDTSVQNLAPLALVSLFVLIGQIMLGGWTSSNYAALACTALPICEGNWMDNLAIADAFSPFQGQHPSFEFGVLDYHARMTIHIAHRIGAIITASLLLLLAYRLFVSTQLKALSLLLVGLLILQVSLGISNVVMHLPLGIAVSHNGGAALLLLTLVTINYFLWHKSSSTSRV